MGPMFWGNQTWFKCMVIFKDFPLWGRPIVWVVIAWHLFKDKLERKIWEKPMVCFPMFSWNIWFGFTHNFAVASGAATGILDHISQLFQWFVGIFTRQNGGKMNNYVDPSWILTHIFQRSGSTGWTICKQDDADISLWIASWRIILIYQICTKVPYLVIWFPILTCTCFLSNRSFSIHSTTK